MHPRWQYGSQPESTQRKAKRGGSLSHEEDVAGNPVALTGGQVSEAKLCATDALSIAIANRHAVGEG